MKVTRVYTDERGESHFAEEEIPLREAGKIGRLSTKVPATGIIFRENDPEYDYDWHNAPSRQYVILLDGHIELEVSDGRKRRFKRGDILLVEDTTGKGHKSRTLDARPRRSVFVTLE